MSPALLIFLIPLAVFALGLKVYGRLFEKSLGSYRVRDFFASTSVLIGFTLATISAAWDEGAEADADTWCLTAVPCGDCANCVGPQIANPYRTAK